MQDFEQPFVAVSRILFFDVFYVWLIGVLETVITKERVVAGKSWTFWADFDGLRTPSQTVSRPPCCGLDKSLS
jgi:hypothetical protein